MLPVLCFIHRRYKLPVCCSVPITQILTSNQMLSECLAVLHQISSDILPKSYDWVRWWIGAFRDMSLGERLSIYCFLICVWVFEQSGLLQIPETEPFIPVPVTVIWCGGGGGGGGFFLTFKDFGTVFDHSFPTCTSFCYWGGGENKVEISLSTLIPLFRPGSVHSSSASVPWWVACELVSWQVPTLCLDSGIVSSLWLRWVKGVCVFSVTCHLHFGQNDWGLLCVRSNPRLPLS